MTIPPKPRGETRQPDGAPLDTRGNSRTSRIPTVMGVTTLLFALFGCFALAPEMTAVVLVLFLVIVLQYFLWGRWLGDLIRQEDAEESERESDS